MSKLSPDLHRRLQRLDHPQQALHAVVAHPLLPQVQDQVAEVVDVAAGEARRAVDQGGLLVEGEAPGPLRMMRVGQESPTAHREAETAKAHRG